MPHILAQLVGAVAASAVLCLIASGKAGFDLSAGFAANGYGDHSPGKYSMMGGLIAEVVLTVNPARSTGPALFVGGWAMAQLWLFWVAPIVGGALGGYAYRVLLQQPAKP